MTPDTQYGRAALTRHAWPSRRYQLQRVRCSDRADAPALFRVWGDGVQLGLLTVTADGVSYGGFAAGELADAVAAVRRAVEARGRLEAPDER